MIHILTNYRNDLKGLEPEQVLAYKYAGEVRIDPPKHAISVLVQGIDEYTTKADWDQMWRERVTPALEEFREERGQSPHGQQAPKLERLKEGLSLYERFLELGSVDKVLEEFQNADLPQGNLEDETARRVIRDLQVLLDPDYLATPGQDLEKMIEV